jgi:hypothetical protein
MVLECFHKQKTTKITVNFPKIVELHLNSSSQCIQLQSLPETMGQIVKRLNTANVQFPPCPLFNVAVIKK